MLVAMNQRLIKISAGAAAAVVIALGGMAIAHGSGNSAAADGNGFPGARGAGAPRPYGFGGGFHGGPGRDDHDDVTGAAATKVTAAVKAKYPNATVRGIHQLPDGSYLALAINGNDFLPVHVSKDLKVTGTLQRPGPGDPDHDHHGFGPDGGSMPYGAPPQGGWGAAPQGSQSSGATTSQQ
jgi:hypothetical protein